MSPIFKDSTSPSRTSFKDGEDASAIKWGVNEFAGGYTYMLVNIILQQQPFVNQNPLDFKFEQYYEILE